jgi:D-cysteine desulfhydrase
MNELYQRHQLPTDFVYTAKLLFGLFDLASKSYFEGGSRLLVIHSGGLQGNRSLSPGTLTFL